MALAVVSRVIAAPVDDVWSRLRGFTSWHSWLPRIVAIAMDPGDEAGQVGCVRSLELADGSRIRERLVALDDDAHRISYAFEGPHRFAARNYLGSVRLDEVTAPAGTFVHWSGRFDADEADEVQLAKVFATIYESFLDALETAATSPVTR